MKIYSTNKTDLEKMIYLERYVNDGSPSGYTFINNTSEGSRAFDSQEYIILYLIEFFHEKDFSIGKVFNKINDNQILIHPDLKDCVLESGDCFIAGEVKAIPLASGRTVYVPKYECFLKLEYNKMLGRIDRKITELTATHSININQLFENEFPRIKKLFYFPETHARIFKFSNGNTIGMLCREFSVAPNIDRSYVIIPAFSLFSKDINDINEPSILHQLLEREGNKEEFFLNSIILPTITLYFELILKFGLQIEGHAQNVCYVFTNKIEGVAIRDFESIDKDLALGVEYNHLFNADYKCIKVDSLDVAKRHSFMFDFKLGEYLLTPLINEAVKCGCNQTVIEEAILNKVEYYLHKLPQDFFPENEWYSYPNTIIDRTTSKRPYIKGNNPKYRKRK